MPRRRRIDHPGATNHVMNRGVARATIFHDQDDNERFLTLLARTADENELIVHAFALMGNHFHIALRVQGVPLFTAMSKLCTSYALAYNTKYERVGHVFQGRYRSILVQSGEYLRRLIRYIHLNPVRAGMIQSLQELRQSPLTGHRELMGVSLPRIISLPQTLSIFGEANVQARAAIELAMSNQLPIDDYLAALLDLADESQSHGVALARPDSNWNAVPGVAIGSAEFVAQFKLTSSKKPVCAIEEEQDVSSAALKAQQIARDVCDEMGVSIQSLASGQRTRAVSNARAAIAYLCHRNAQVPHREIARVIGISESGVTRAIQKGYAIAATLKLSRKEE